MSHLTQRWAAIHQHRQERSFTWLDEVVGRGRDSEAVGDVGGAEVVHLIIEDDPSGPGHDFGTEAGEEKS